MVDDFKDKIFLNKVVKFVFYNCYGVRVSIVDGEIYFGSYGLCMFSIGVLLSDFVVFLFKFFQWKIEVINKILLVYYMKIFIKFFFKFWDSYEFILYVYCVWGYYLIWMDIEVYDILLGLVILYVIVIGEMSFKVESQLELEMLKEIMIELKKVYGVNILEVEGRVVYIYNKVEC